MINGHLDIRYVIIAEVGQKVASCGTRPAADLPAR